MRRRELTHEELDKVIKLKKIGTSWLKIEHETGISRRTAKRAYEKWEHSQSPEVLREARKDVAAKAFLDHLKSLTTLAGSLVTSLSVPSSIADMERNAEQFFSELLQQDLLKRRSYMSTDDLELHQPPGYPTLGDTQFNTLENKLLLKCLQDHTCGEGVRWEALNEWKKARDNCAKVLPNLWKETSKVVNNFLNQERGANFLQRVKERSGEDDPAKRMASVKRMAEAVINEIWRAILQDKLDEKGPWFETVPVDIQSPQDIPVKARSGIYYRFAGIEKPTHICNLAANNLCKGDMVQQLPSEVRKMKKATEELREMLNPIKLIPMILRTRCELCPA